MIKYLLPYAIALLALQACTADSSETNAFNDNDNDTNIGFELSPVDYNVLLTREAPVNGIFTQKTLKVISDQATLDAELARYGEPASSQNFDNGQALLVDMGIRSSGGFSIEVTGIAETSTHLLATVYSTVPGENCGTDDAFTNPFQMVFVESKKELLIIETLDSSPCTLE